jgi:Tfp pilus assembly protein PilV
MTMREVLTLPETLKLRSSRGFTIMEVALAATVLAFTLMGMIGVVEAGAQMLDLSRKQTMATQILHGEIDQLRLQSWLTISGYVVGGVAPAFGNGYPAGPTTLTTASDPSLAAIAGQYPAVTSIFTLTRTVTCIEPVQANLNPAAYTSTPLLIQVTFTIRWSGVTGHSYSRTDTTFVSANGLSVAYQRS